jgi:cytochrome c oxidase assembly factor CtaG
MSFLGVYAHVLFWTYAVQIITLLLVAPILLVLGRPLLLARTARRSSDRPPANSIVWNSAFVRTFAYPPLATVVITVIPLLLFFTPWFETTLTRAAQYALLHVVLLAAGVLFFWSNVAVDPLPRPFSRPVSTLLVFVETIVDALPGLILWLKATPIAAGYYLSVARPWGRSILDDQKLGGQLYWGIGELIGLPLLLLVALEWMRSDEREAKREDRRMDEERPARVDIETATQLETPWWITDPDRLGRGR